MQQLYASVPLAKALGPKAQAILVFPKVTKAGLGIGGQYGEGALLKEGAAVAYYKTTGASFGLQAGGQKYGYAMFFMNAKALDEFQKASGFEVGVGPSVVLVDEGMAKSTTTTTFKDDIYAFVFGQKGLMAGLGIQGNKITRSRRSRLTRRPRDAPGIPAPLRRRGGGRVGRFARSLAAPAKNSMNLPLCAFSARGTRSAVACGAPREEPPFLPGDGSGTETNVSIPRAFIQASVAVALTSVTFFAASASGQSPADAPDSTVAVSEAGVNTPGGDGCSTDVRRAGTRSRTTGKKRSLSGWNRHLGNGPPTLTCLSC